jgi:hypothetical protein
MSAANTTTTAGIATLSALSSEVVLSWMSSRLPATLMTTSSPPSVRTRRERTRNGPSSTGTRWIVRSSDDSSGRSVAIGWLPLMIGLFTTTSPSPSTTWEARSSSVSPASRLGRGSLRTSAATSFAR